MKNTVGSTSLSYSTHDQYIVKNSPSFFNASSSFFICAPVYIIHCIE